MDLCATALDIITNFNNFRNICGTDVTEGIVLENKKS